MMGGVIAELRRSGRPALLVGEPDGAGLRFCGVVEWEKPGPQVAELIRSCHVPATCTKVVPRGWLRSG